MQLFTRQQELGVLVLKGLSRTYKGLELGHCCANKDHQQTTDWRQVRHDLCRDYLAYGGDEYALLTQIEDEAYEKYRRFWELTHYFLDNLAVVSNVLISKKIWGYLANITLEWMPDDLDYTVKILLEIVVTKISDSRCHH